MGDNTLPRRANTLWSVLGDSWSLPTVPLSRLFRSVTFYIMLAQFVVFIVAIVNSGGVVTPSENSAFGPSGCELIKMGAKYSPFIAHKKQYWRLISALFIHSGFLSLIFSLVFEYLVVLPIELEHGFLMAVLIFFLCGIVGYSFSTMINPLGIHTGALPSILGFVGFRLAHMLIDYQSFVQGGANRTGIIEGVTILLTLIAGQNAYIDNYSSFAGCIMGFFLGATVISSKLDDDDDCYKRSLVSLAAVSGVFIIFICMISLGVGTGMALIDQYMWGFVCKTSQPSLLEPFTFY